MNRQNEKNNVKTYLKYLDSSIPHSIANFKLHGNKLIFMYLKHIAHHIKTISILKWDKLTSNIFHSAIHLKYIDLCNTYKLFISASHKIFVCLLKTNPTPIDILCIHWADKQTTQKYWKKLMMVTFE